MGNEDQANPTQFSSVSIGSIHQKIRDWESDHEVLLGEFDLYHCGDILAVQYTRGMSEDSFLWRRMPFKESNIYVLPSTRLPMNMRFREFWRASGAKWKYYSRVDRGDEKQSTKQAVLFPLHPCMDSVCIWF